MNKFDFASFASGVIPTIVIGLLACAVTHSFTKHEVHLKASAMGHGEFIMTDSGFTEFKWKEPIK